MNEELNSAEREYIEKEAARIDSSERYFDARPQFDTVDRRKVFESGFDRGWQAALSAKSVPEGWKLVPTEPTDEMLMKGGDIDASSDGLLRAIYSEMIEAAPQPDDSVRECSHIFIPHMPQGDSTYSAVCSKCGAVPSSTTKKEGNK